MFAGWSSTSTRRSSGRHSWISPRRISKVVGVEAVNLTVTEIDIETVGFNVTIEGDNLSYDALVEAIEHIGAVVHSIDQLVAGDRIVEEIKRGRA
jgi:hypothetical protein